MASGVVEPEPPARRLARLARRFELEHGRPPESVASAPGRVNLVGEHVDYNGGRCLPIAVRYSTYVAASARRDKRLTVRSQQQSESYDADLSRLGPGSLTGWPAYVGGVLWALGEEGVSVPGVDLLVDGNVPLGAGLASSAALTVATALAVLDVAGATVPRERLVSVCMRAEREVAGAPTGGMDQTVALFAEPGHALLLDTADGSRRQVPWCPSDLGAALLVVDTGVRHALNDGRYAVRRADCERAARLLGVRLLADVADPLDALPRLPAGALRRRARHVLSEIARVDAAVGHLERAEGEAFGACLTASHRSLRDDFEVSFPEADTAVAAALRAGAWGARLTGAGFGGSVVALVPTVAAADVTAAVADALSRLGRPDPVFLDGAAVGAAGLLVGSSEPDG